MTQVTLNRYLFQNYENVHLFPENLISCHSIFNFSSPCEAALLKLQFCNILYSLPIILYRLHLDCHYYFN